MPRWRCRLSSASWARRFGACAVIVPAVLACSLIFFAATNFAVWAFSGMYSLDMRRA